MWEPRCLTTLEASTACNRDIFTFFIFYCDVFYRLQEIEAEFDKHVSIKDITQHMDVDPESRQYIYNYWKLKRKV
jgi:hypothetical protein